MMTFLRRVTLATVALGLASITVVGCTAPTAGNVGAETDADITIAVVSHGSPGDSFWDVVKSGAEAAGGEIGATVTYQSDPNPVGQSQLIAAAIASDVDGLVVSMANPEGVRAAVESAVAAGIPVITMNSGLEQSAEYGAQTHVGQSEFIAGEAAGTKFAEEGGTNAICVIHEVGNSGLEDRCAGFASTFGGQVNNVQVDVENLADAQNTITTQLLTDPSIDTVLTLNSGVAVSASQAIAEAGSPAELGTFDVSSDVIDLIENEQMTFAIDQQPFSQGYLPVIMLGLRATNGDVVGGGQPVYSGPGFVTAENAAEVAEFAANGTR